MAVQSLRSFRKALDAVENLGWHTGGNPKSLAILGRAYLTAGRDILVGKVQVYAFCSVGMVQSLLSHPECNRLVVQLPDHLHYCQENRKGSNRKGCEKGFPNRGSDRSSGRDFLGRM